MSERIGAEIDDVRRRTQAVVQRYVKRVDDARRLFLDHRSTGTTASQREANRLGDDLERKREDLHRSMIALRAGMVIAGVNEDFATDAIQRGGYSIQDRSFVLHRKKPLEAFTSLGGDRGKSR